jgi:hypothetical protein
MYQLLFGSSKPSRVPPGPKDIEKLQRDIASVTLRINYLRRTNANKKEIRELEKTLEAYQKVHQLIVTDANRAFVAQSAQRTDKIVDQIAVPSDTSAIRRVRERVGLLEEVKSDEISSDSETDDDPQPTMQLQSVPIKESTMKLPDVLDKELTVQTNPPLTRKSAPTAVAVGTFS